MSTILEIREAYFGEKIPYDCGVEDLSLSICAGEFYLIRLPLGSVISPLPDLAAGLLEPERGSVRFNGTDWNAMSADAASAARGTIGRVFERAGWVSNLDLDENITLPQRYHARRSMPDTLAEARMIADELQLGEIPPGRPARLDRAQLLRWQWVRALMGKPALLVLERPVRDLPPDAARPFFDAVQRRVEQHGLAVLWLTDAHEPLDASTLRPTRKYAMQEGRLREVP